MRDAGTRRHGDTGNRAADAARGASAFVGGRGGCVRPETPRAPIPGSPRPRVPGSVDERASARIAHCEA